MRTPMHHNSFINTSVPLYCKVLQIHTLVHALTPTLQSTLLAHLQLKSWAHPSCLCGSRTGLWPQGADHLQKALGKQIFHPEIKLRTCCCDYSTPVMWAICWICVTGVGGSSFWLLICSVLLKMNPSLLLINIGQLCSHHIQLVHKFDKKFWALRKH